MALPSGLMGCSVVLHTNSCRFDPQLGRVWEATNQCVSCLSLSNQ